MPENNKPMGSPRAEYLPSRYGPFACHNCQHFKWPHLCDHPEVIEDAKAKAGSLKIGPRGLAVVEPGGCCEYFRS